MTKEQYYSLQFACDVLKKIHTARFYVLFYDKYGNTATPIRTQESLQSVIHEIQLQWVETTINDPRLFSSECQGVMYTVAATRMAAKTIRDYFKRTLIDGGSVVVAPAVTEMINAITVKENV